MSVGADVAASGAPLTSSADDSTVPLLELRSVDAAYGPFRALFGVSLAVRPGTVTALLGANGAGKTTVARVATGLVRPTAGEMWFEGSASGSWSGGSRVPRGSIGAASARSRSLAWGLCTRPKGARCSRR